MLHALCKLLMTNMPFSHGTMELDNFVKMVRYEIGRNKSSCRGDLESIGNELPGQRTLWVRKYPVCQLNNCIVVDIYTLIHGVTLHLLYVDIGYMFVCIIYWVYYILLDIDTHCCWIYG